MKEGLEQSFPQLEFEFCEGTMYGLVGVRPVDARARTNMRFFAQGIRKGWQRGERDQKK